MFIKHATIERSAFLLLILILITVAIGGIVEIVPPRACAPPARPPPVG